MAALDDLILQISDDNLRGRIKKEVDELKRTKTFGLVFEQHQPECTPLYNVPVKINSLVALKAGNINDTYRVYNIKDHKVFCYRNDESFTFDLNDVVTVAQFGDPIFPYLQPIDAVANAPDSDLWHALIEAENYHALQLLNYLYAGKVDCIYIDPPYNTGARDWKYNNNYVDSGDKFSSSKWLSMMQRRLELAKKLLNPADSVLIVTIDEHEYLHLGCLLEEMFRGARIQMVTTVIKPEGTQRVNEFSRTNEFIFFVFLGSAVVLPCKASTFENEAESETYHLPYRNFRRTNSANIRTSRPNQFYPIFIDEITKKIVSVGDVMTPNIKQTDIVPPKNCFSIFPVRESGEEMIWYKTPSSFKYLLEQVFIKGKK